MNFALSRYNNMLVKNEGSSNDVSASSYLELWWVESSALQHVAGLGLSVAAAKLLGKSLWPTHVADKKRVLFVASLGHWMGTLATNAAGIVIKSDIALFLGACQPLFTILLLSLRNFAPFQSSKLLSVLAIVIGVGALQGGHNVVFNMQGLLVATVSTLAFTTRNVLLCDIYELHALLEIFVVMSSLSAVLSLPLWCIKVLTTGSVFTSNIPVGGLAFLSFIHPVYSFSSFKVLEMVTPVTHAIVTVCIAGFEITQVNWSWNLIGIIFTIIAGFYTYQYGNGLLKKKFLFLMLLFLVTYLVLGNWRSAHIRNSTPSRDDLYTATAQRVKKGISTAWLYDRPITENIVANIGDLADNNPSMKVYVYCGTTRCVREVAALEKENVVVGFALVGKIVKGTPLEKWVARHPINKLLAGQEFESHLHEVAILGILWQYGGYYVNPMVRTNSSLSKYHNDTMAVVSEEVTVPKGSLSSVFDVVCFTPKHRIIEELIEVYVSKYPKVSDPSSLTFSFMNKVWVSVKNERIKRMYKDRIHISNSSHNAIGTKHYGHLVSEHSIVSHTDRLCDEMENFSGLQYLPFVDSTIERSNLQLFNSSCNVTAFFNGKWGMLNQKGLPLNSLNPIMLSVHFDGDVTHNWSDYLDYLQTHEPIGCRDTATLNYLRANGIKAFSSSSLMLLMKNLAISRFNVRENIYLTDVKAENKNLLPLKIRAKAIKLDLDKHDRISLPEVAYQLIEKFGSAKLVITENFQHALLCVAVETPVVFIINSTQELKVLPDTLGSLVHLVDKSSLTENQTIEWFQTFPWNNVPPNPNPAILMKLRATSWNVIHQNLPLREAALKFGTIPMSPPLSLEGVHKLNFFLIFTTNGTVGSDNKLHGNFNWKHWRTIESIFYHHPTAIVKIYSNTLSDNIFNVLVESGYSIQVQRYSLEKVLVGTPAESFIKKLDKARKTRYWYANESDILRMLLMYKLSGIYMDTDVIIVRPFYTLPENVLAWEADQKMVNGAVMKFEKGNLYLKACLEEFAKHFNGRKWGANGPQLLNRVYFSANWGDDVIKIVDRKTFYMIHWSKIGYQCFSETKGKTFDANMEALKNVAFAVHTNGKVTGSKGVYSSLKNGTICKHLYTSYCVLCDQIH